jgi:hypothetical protein
MVGCAFNHDVGQACIHITDGESVRRCPEISKLDTYPHGNRALKSQEFSLVHHLVRQVHHQKV